MTDLSNAENVLPLPKIQEAVPTSGGIATRGQSIIALLSQATEMALQREARARAQAQHWYLQSAQLEEKVRILESQLRQTEERVVVAERWIERIFLSVRDTLLAPLLERSAHRPLK